MVDIGLDSKSVLVTKTARQRGFRGQDIVHVFDLHGNGKATRAYAWSSPMEGSDRRRFYAVLHLGGLRSPLDAVRAPIRGRAPIEITNWRRGS